MDQNKLQELQAKYGDIYEISVEDKRCYVRKPNRKDLSYISAITNPVQMSETLLNTLWVDGDEDIRKEDDLFLAVAKTLSELIQVKEAQIKKL